MKLELDPTSVVKHVIELSGGHDAAFEKFDAEYKQLMAVWEQDSHLIGRILRAHLFVEHFLNELLRAKNPDLGLDKARLSFAQKVSLVGSGSAEIEDLLLGIRRLNAVRNRLAHSLHADLTTEDADVLLNCRYFRALRDEGARTTSRKASTEPIDVVEDFALHVGVRVQSHVSGNAVVWAEAIRLAQEEASNT
jgi:hypothetical protein